ncbi:MAG: CDP-diacylglycerol--glycerol-3-phosphate 3-phosphatidyltransferase [Clostridia bacterium]|nr:CDP-diacylglycerol--glycerol-3-phosphate 3-phosphatidyltransferase [Clostridia bacterium]
MNLPNRLTLLRIALVPAMCAFICVETRWAQLAAALIFLAASITDMFDGRIARNRHLITDFGKLMDPVADKLLVTAAMIFLTAQHRMYAGVCVVFIAREFIISGFRLVAASRGVVIAAGPLGKYKTVTQMIAVVMSILCLPFHAVPATLNWIVLTVLTHVMMWTALVLAVLSCVDYIRRNRGVIDTTNI